MKSVKTLIILLVTGIVLSLALNIYLFYQVNLQSDVETGVKEKITLEVVIDVDNYDKATYSYTLVGSEAEKLVDVMDEVGLDYVHSDGWINTIHGITPSWSEHKQSWWVLINGEDGQLSILEQPVKNGDVITIELRQFE